MVSHISREARRLYAILHCAHLCNCAIIVHSTYFPDTGLLFRIFDINGNLEVQLISDRSELLLNFFFEAMALGEKPGEFCCQAVHLLFKGFSVVLLLCDTHVAAGSKDIVPLADVVKAFDGTKAFLVFQFATAVVVKESGNVVDVILRRLS